MPGHPGEKKIACLHTSAAIDCYDLEMTTLVEINKIVASLHDKNDNAKI